jgi:hypothetical protein
MKLCKSFTVSAIFAPLHITAIVVSMVALCGCGNSPSTYSNTDKVFDQVQETHYLDHTTTPPTKVFSFNYEMKEYHHTTGKFCTTEHQTFTGKTRAEALAAFCKALQDDDTNNQCAPELRSAHVQKSCVTSTDD